MGTVAGERPSLDRDPRVLNALRILGFVVLAIVLLRTAWVSDDAYITLRTVDNLAHGYGLRWNVAERVETYTHPLWLFIEAIPYAFTHEAFYTCVVLSIAISLAGFGLFALRLRVGTAGAMALGMGMLLASRSFIDYSTSGLENPLSHLLIILYMIFLMESAPGKPRALTRLSVVAGLAVLNRVDLAWLLGPSLLVAALSCPRRQALEAVAIGFLPFALWEIFTVFYYGALVPNSALAKLNTGIDGFTLVRHGFDYLWNSLRNDPVTLTGIAVAVAAAAADRSPRRGRRLAVAGGIVLYLIYVVRIGGDFMSGRFLSSPFVAAVVLLARMDPFPVHRLGRAAVGVVVLVLGTLLTPYPPVVSGSAFGSRLEKVLDRHGICDERRFYFATSGMWNGAPDPARPSGWGPVVAGRDARRNGSRLIVEGAVGVAGYAAGPKVHVLDYHAIGDPLLSHLPAVVNDTGYQQFMLNLTGDLDPQGWRIGHFRRQIPDGYLATLLTGENRIEDPNVARFYDRLRLVTRGPLWSGSRLTAAIQMSLGGRTDFLPRARPAFDDPIRWSEMLAVDPNQPEALYQLGLQSAEAGDLETALARLEEAVRLDPGHARALFLLTRIWTGKGDTVRADAYANQLQRAAPELHLGAAPASGQ